LLRLVMPDLLLFGLLVGHTIITEYLLLQKQNTLLPAGVAIS
jgi:hypothetical protein